MAYPAANPLPDDMRLEMLFGFLNSKLMLKAKEERTCFCGKSNMYRALRHATKKRRAVKREAKIDDSRRHSMRSPYKRLGGAKSMRGRVKMLAFRRMSSHHTGWQLDTYI